MDEAMKSIDQTVSEIQSLTLQGATNVAIAVLDFLTDAVSANPTISPAELKAMGTRLAYARPTEPLAQNALRYIFTNSSTPIAERINEYKTFIDQAKQTVTANGAPLLVDGGVYLTLCHSSTTVRLFQEARANGAYFSLYIAETRPRYQGRITATELLNLGFDDVTMIIDDVAVSLIEGRKGKIDAVFIGADLLSEKGFVNKVGSLAVSAAAQRHDIPVYTLTTLLKFDPRPFHPTMIETRSSDEIWKEAPETLQFYTPAFDYVPYYDNVQLVCETGVITGHDLREAVQKKYPFVLETPNPS